MGDLLKNPLFLRVASALVLMPLVLFALVYNVWTFLALMGIGLAIACYEWMRMSRLLPHHHLHLFVGLVYILIGFFALIEMRIEYRAGLGLTLALLISIWSSDSGAYFAGKAIGGPKMTPTVSPNKTWAGLFGGMLSSALALFLYGRYIGPSLSDAAGIADYTALEAVSIPLLLILGAFLTIAGQVGDLLVSYFKRKAGIKDTGHLIPGHGGILDRIDSLLFAAPVFLITLKVLGL